MKRAAAYGFITALVGITCTSLEYAMYSTAPAVAGIAAVVFGFLCIPVMIILEEP